MISRYDIIGTAAPLPNSSLTIIIILKKTSRLRYTSDYNHVACQTIACVQGAQPSPRKKTRRRQKRKGKKKVVERRKEKQRARQRMPSGVPEQESGCSPIQVKGALVKPVIGFFFFLDHFHIFLSPIGGAASRGQMQPGLLLH